LYRIQTGSLKSIFANGYSFHSLLFVAVFILFPSLVVVSIIGTLRNKMQQHATIYL